MKHKLFYIILALIVITLSGYSQDGALSFPGTSGTHVDLGTSLDVYNKQHLTVEMWVYPNNLSPADCFFSLPGTNYTLAFTLGAPWNMVRVEFGSANTASTPSGVLYNLEWFHLAFVFDGTGATDADKVKIYINGLKQTLSFKKTIPTASPAAPTGGILIGEDASSGKLFTGLVDNVAIWNTSRTGTEVQYDMNVQPTGDESGLQSFFPMNGTGTSTTATDISSNGNDGTLVGFTMDPSPWTSRAITEPGTQATNIVPSNITATQQDLSWTNGSGSSRAVFIKATSASESAVPVDGTVYKADAVYGGGDTPGNGWFCIYNGTGNTVKVSGLSASTSYRVMVCEYNGSTGSENYNTIAAVGNPANVPTNATVATVTVPTIQASSLLCNNDFTSSDISWTNGNGVKRLVFVKLNGTGVPSPADNTTYTANPIYGSGGQDAGGWYCVYNGTQTSVTVTGLTPGLTYRVMVQEYNGIAGTEKYNKTTATLNPVNFSKVAAVWDGSSSSDWATAGNWAGNAVPGSGDDVFIPAGTLNDPVIGNTTSASCNDLVVDALATLTINSSNENSNGSLIVSGTSTGIVTYNRWMDHIGAQSGSGFKWHLISTPVQGNNYGSTFFAANNVPSNAGNYAFATYNTIANVWNSYYSGSSDFAFSAGQGYLMTRASAGTINFTGTVADSDVTFSPESGAGNLRWNCVGNPFTSAISINPLSGASNFMTINSANLDVSFTGIYVWDEDASITEYQEVNNVSAYYLQAGQGFFVKAASGATEIILPREIQIHQPTADFKSGTIDNAMELDLFASMENSKSKTRIFFIENMTSGLDIGYDAGKFKSGPISLYTQLVEDNGVDFGIQCLSKAGIENFEIPIGLDVTEGGEVIFSLNQNNFPPNLYPILEDRILDVKIPFMNNADTYVTTINENSKGYGRFYLSFSNTTGAEEIVNARTNYKAWFQNNAIQIMGNPNGTADVVLFDLNGIILSQYKISNQQMNSIPMGNFNSGIYLVKITDAKGTELMKVPVIK